MKKELRPHTPWGGVNKKKKKKLSDMTQLIGDGAGLQTQFDPCSTLSALNIYATLYINSLPP